MQVRIFKFGAVAAVVVAMFAMASAASAAGYAVKGTGGLGLTVRSGPGSQFSAVGKVGEGGGINIVCQTRGTNILGSTVWDQIDSPVRGYVTDYYTSTPLFNQFSPGIPQCGAAAVQTPAPAVGRNEQAARWAEAHVNQVYTTENRNATWWSGWCETFVEKAYNGLFHSGSAIAQYNFRKNSGQIRTGVPPRGALVFYGGGGGYGHVAIGVGNGQIVGTMGFAKDRLPVSRTSYTYFRYYLGWAMP